VVHLGLLWRGQLRLLLHELVVPEFGWLHARLVGPTLILERPGLKAGRKRLARALGARGFAVSPLAFRHSAVVFLRERNVTD
jgi:hypothetical protein